MKYKENVPELKLVKPIGGFHGVSAIFPKLKDIIDYEEKKIIINQGYPRFVTHPLLKKIEIKHQKRFNATGAISCCSYKAAIFLVLDYFFRQNSKLYFDENFPNELFEFLNQKFPSAIKKTDISDADVIFLAPKKGKVDIFQEGRTIVGILGDEDLDRISNNVKFDIMVYRDSINKIGIISFFHIRYAILEILRRHCGFNVSSRKLIRNKQPSTEIIRNYERLLKKRIADLENGYPEYCYLYPSGMAAVFTSILSLLSKERPKFIALGSLYVDTFRILEKWPQKFNLDNTIFIRDAMEENLEKSIDSKTAGVIVEIPSNPLIQLIDIKKVVDIAHSRGAKVIVDNTIATPYNFNPFDYEVDIIIHSTTKFLSGKNNHIGGVLLTMDSEIAEKVKNFNDIINLNMDFNDMKVLYRNLRNFEKRMKIINENTKVIANFLYNHDSIEKVYYPSLEGNPYHFLMKKYLKAGSGLISFVLRNSNKENAERFYDNIISPILKGPSLGSEKTLLSPYVIMAHYEDSKEELARLGFDFYLMRLSVGVEPVERIINSLKQALKFVD